MSDNSYNLCEKFKDRCSLYVSRLLNEPPEKPEFIIVDVTHRCNLKCLMCDIRKEDINVKELTTDEIKDIIDQCIEWGVKEVVLSGGEPFTRKDIPDIIQYVKKKRYNIGILTNGIVLSKGLIKKITPYLVDKTLSLTISLDGCKAETHDKIRGVKGSFEKTYNLIEYLSNLKKENKNVNFSTISIVLNENLEELPRLFDLLKKKNVNSIQFQPLLANNISLYKRSKEVTLWVPEERLGVLEDTLKSLIKLKKENKSLIVNALEDLKLIKKYFQQGLSKDDVKCYAVFRTMLIANDGRITVCGTEYGDIRKCKLKESWFSKDAEFSRNLIKNCKNPCLLPCFTDFNMSSITKIGDNFIEDLNKNNIEKEEKINYLKEGLNLLNKYEEQLLKC